MRTIFLDFVSESLEMVMNEIETKSMLLYDLLIDNDQQNMLIILFKAQNIQKRLFYFYNSI